MTQPPPGPLIPPSVNFSSMYASLAEINTILPPAPLQQEIVTLNTSVAMSQDGSTAVVGYNSGVGYINVYVSTNNVWALQAGPLVGTGNTGNSEQGNSVSITANGNMIVVGGPSDNSNVGAFWVFKRTGTTWSQYAGPLVGSGAIGAANSGFAAAIAADGSVIVSSGYSDNSGIGATWIFVNNGSTFIQQAKLVGTGNTGSSNQGSSVAITGLLSNYTVIVGAYEDNSSVGAAWIFTGLNGIWSQQGSKLVPQGMIGSFSYFGSTVSINGTTAIVSGPYDNSDVGAVWVFNYIAGTWTQTQKLVGSGFVYSFPYEGYGGIVLSNDGLSILISGIYADSYIGGFWIFTYNTTTNLWSQKGPRFITNANTVNFEDFGSAIACNSNAKKIIVGSTTAVFFITFT